jgi:aerobic-type carbon monoxide dehydrogenase small subunit (CoxS/CutS family)
VEREKPHTFMAKSPRFLSLPKGCQRLKRRCAALAGFAKRQERLMASITLTINGSDHTIEAAPNMPLLWALRDLVGLTGTKYGCGIGACGACAVLLDGVAVRACVTPAPDAAGHAITTIEGLSADGSHPVQRAWLAEAVSQCGYCQAGQMIAAAALLSASPHPTDAEIDAALAGSLCRCGTYMRIRRAIHRAAGG